MVVRRALKCRQFRRVELVLSGNVLTGSEADNVSGVASEMTLSYNVLEVVMGLLLWIVFGLIAGAAAKFIMPGRDPGGIIVTILLGIGGAFLGGMLATALGFGTVTSFDLRGLVIAIGGALVLLIGYRFLSNRAMA
jgi:uncharacterized membrane protein YeaQ/YmgE (transglycosylase-associated protein family)